MGDINKYLKMCILLHQRRILQLPGAAWTSTNIENLCIITPAADCAASTYRLDIKKYCKYVYYYYISCRFCSFQVQPGHQNVLKICVLLYQRPILQLPGAAWAS